MSSLQELDQSFDEVLEDILGWDLEISDDDGPGTVEGWDSLAQVRLIHALETRFAVRLPDAALFGELTAGALKRLIREQLAGSWRTLRGAGSAFSEEELLAFAEASGDRNPVHIDARFARRTPFGGPIVHGSLLTLGALGCLPDEVLSRVRGLEVSFGGAVRPGEPVTAETRHSRHANAWEVRLSGRGKLLVRVVTREAPIPGPGFGLP